MSGPLDTPTTTWTAVTPGSSVTPSLLTQILDESATVAANATAAAASATAAASSASSASSSASSATTSATAAASSATSAATSASNAATSAAAAATSATAAAASAASITNDSVLKAGDTMTGTLILPAGTTTVPPVRIPHGSAPTTPTNGDVWTTTAGLYVRINGATVGPLGTGGGGGDALTTNPLSQFAATTSAQLAGVISDETGSGALVFATSPTLVTPNIGVATATSVNGVGLTDGGSGALTVTGTASVSGSNTGDQTTVSGNAGSATVLQTARTINGVSFDGSANITVTAAAGTLTGATLAAGVTASSLTSVGTLSSLTVGGAIVMGDNEVQAAVHRDTAYYSSAPTISAGTLTLDYTAGPFFLVSLNADITTLSITNVPATTKVAVLTMRFTADGTARSITWPASFRWGTAGAPTMTSTSGKVDYVQAVSVDGGTTWDAFLNGQNF